MNASVRQPAVQLRSVSKRFGDRLVLDRLDLSISDGDFVSIIGRSGCGKSTLLRLVAGLDAPDEGAVDVRNASEALGSSQGSARRRMMFQEARLLPWKSVLANVMLGCPPSARDEARAALREVGLGGRERDWPAQLSGGQRQRVALARALVHRPSLLLLDEPFGALDALTRLEMHTLLTRLWREHRFTAVLVTHDVHEAVTLSDRIVLIEDGRVALDEPVAIPRPRARASGSIAELEEAVLQRMLVPNGHAAALVD
ncbi:ATP-binding cassette domain-containing protein [Trinickia dinghuensis]|uniref:ATP-binding cassette domain-containing protein n=2 Tax=Trinickia dinghuensis TaxID=2291023 RepID=A0A3D8JY78_9BURK|nr:ATP-binding cassette domain-containing protein [Trinickia dinghuensis]